MEKEQIVKALECCANGSYDACAQCPLHDSPSSLSEECMEVLMEQALSLIREQEKRIEQLGRIFDSYAMQYGTATDKDVFLKKERADTVRKMREKLYREFASLGEKDKFNKKFFLEATDKIANQLLEENT